MKKNLLYLFILIGFTVDAKCLVDLHPSTTIVTNCTLNVGIGSTLDTPTSTFFVNITLLNGTAPYTYLLDGNPSPDGYIFYAETLTIGIHTVMVTDSNGCSGTGSFYVQSLAVKTSKFILPNFKFYPNPVTNNLQLSNTSVIEKIEIVSLAGKIILTKRINSNQSEIDLSNISIGVYLLKVTSEGREKIVKFIKK